MSEMRQHTVQCLSPGGLHRMAYVEWGDPANPRVLVCVHGLTRNARDFDFLAQTLSKHYRVVCPDVVGRGRSNWLRIKEHYQLQQYVADMVTLVARLGVNEVHWVGTSMGGMIGMALAAQAETPIVRLVLNDVGPVISAAAVKRIGEYVGVMPQFASFNEAEQYVRLVSAPFGRLSDAQWKHLTEHVTRQTAGGYELVYDPGPSARTSATTTSACGRSTTPSAARPWWCAARNPTSSATRPAWRWAAAARKPSSPRSPASAMRRCSWMTRRWRWCANSCFRNEGRLHPPLRRQRRRRAGRTAGAAGGAGRAAGGGAGRQREPGGLQDP